MKIDIYDNFLTKDEILKLDKILWNSSFTLNGYTSKMVDKMDREWSLSKTVDENDRNFDFYKIIEERIINLVSVKNVFHCYRNHINANKFGDVLNLHTDYDLVKGILPLTAIIYGNKEWNINWGGETIFSDGEEIIKSVIPKPGRLIVFDATLSHTGRVPSPSFPHFRYTVVYNLISEIKEKTLL